MLPISWKSTLGLVVAFCLLVPPVQPLKKNLADIRYRFTACGSTGRTGPSYQSCADYYSRNGSQLAAVPLVYPEAELGYESAQMFNVSRVGLYNITAAGAAGGRGVCNLERGYGMARQVQVELYTGLKMLVLVGQQGSGYCDFEPASLLCLNRPVSLPDVSECEGRLSVYLEENYNSTSISDMFGISDVFGGGGGGGASLVRVYSSRGFDADPVVVGAGGGGSSALLNYDIVEDLGVAVEGVSSVVAYRQFLNGKPGLRGNGGPGVRNSSSVDSAGAGGGYLVDRSMIRLDVDGGFLGSKSTLAAAGGVHCSGLVNVSAGGYGGGGGGCAGGGGGGGYTGGDVLSTGRLIPGEGGTTYQGSPFRTSFKVISYVSDTLSTKLDGYVDVVHADCECVFKCEVYREEDMFECTCPGSTSLAPDDNDCYEETTLSISEGPASQLPPDENGIVFNYELFTFDTRVFLYSVDFTVVLEQPVDENAEETIHELCIIGFLGEDSQLVAQTDVHRRSLQRLNTLSRVTDEGSQGQVLFLDDPVVVYAGLVVSAGNCSVENMTMNVNISIRDRQLDDIRSVDSDIPLEVAEEYLESFITHLATVSNTVTTPPTAGRTRVYYAAAISSVIATLALVVAGVSIVCCVCFKWKHDRKVRGASLLDSTSESLTLKRSNPSLQERDKSTEIGRGEDYVLYKCTRSE